MRGSWTAVVSALACCFVACAGGGAESSDDDGRTSDLDELVVPSPTNTSDDETGSAEEGLDADAGATSPGPQIVYVDFDGPTIHDCAGCSDATRDRSALIGAFKRSSIDFLPYTDAAGKAHVLSALRRHYAPYDVTFTTTRPSSGEYTMLVVSPTVLPHHGVAPLDCRNRRKSDIAFVYRANQVSHDLLGREATHELGHTFGLTHVTNSADVMQWASSGRTFTVARRDRVHNAGKCFSGEIQHAPAMLRRDLGLRVP